MLLVENNVFNDIKDAHTVSGGKLVARGNIYNHTTGKRDENGSAFTPPYQYELKSRDVVESMVRAGSGPI